MSSQRVKRPRLNVSALKGFGAIHAVAVPRTVQIRPHRYEKPTSNPRGSRRAAPGPWNRHVNALTFPQSGHENPAISVLQTKHGGHVGFVTESLGQPRSWAETQALAFLDG